MESAWEKRWDPLREEWVLMCGHRQERPWVGEVVSTSVRDVPRYDPECTFCPGNTRVSGEVNPQYREIYAFDNDHPCVGEESPVPTSVEAPFRTERAGGHARVICFDPRHDLSLSRMSEEGVERVLLAFREEERRWTGRADVEHVLAFENRGEVVGVSNPHPHGQLYATDFVMPAQAKLARVAARHHADTGRSLLGDVLSGEEKDGRRVVATTDTAVAFVPHFARWAYEVLVVPRSPRAGVRDLEDSEAQDLARCLRDVLRMYDGLWDRPFPYVMVFENGPAHVPTPGFHFHLSLRPPLRRPGLLKYLAGPELGGGTFLADTVPEEKAAELRAAAPASR